MVEINENENVENDKKDLPKDVSKEEVKPEEVKEKSDNGISLEDTKKVTEDLKIQNKEKKDLLDREERLLAERRLSGTTEAGSQPVKKERLTDTEYAEALQKGEVNPLKEDGFIK